MLKMRIRDIKATISSRQKGFTLVEILVVVGILAVLLAVALVAINPNQHFIDSRNSQRRSNVTAVLDAIYEYQAAHEGALPPALASINDTLPHPLALVAVPTDEVDLCNDLVPAVIADLPMDPSAAAPTGGDTPCASGTTAYDTGYTIAKSASNRFTVTAPSTEPTTDPDISVTR